MRSDGEEHDPPRGCGLHRGWRLKRVNGARGRRPTQGPRGGALGGTTRRCSWGGGVQMAIFSAVAVERESSGINSATTENRVQLSSSIVLRGTLPLAV